MMWRVLMRRCPTRSMTVVGDLAQTGSLNGVRSWESTFRPYVADRLRIETLTVNYRTPAQLMALATRVLRADRAAAAGADLGPYERRGSRCSPRCRTSPDAVAEIVREELDLVGAGTLGVITPFAVRPGARGGRRSALPTRRSRC